MTLRPKRITLRLGTSMLLILLVALWLARQTNMARRQKEAVEAVRAQGGWVHYDWEFAGDRLVTNRNPPGPAWLRGWLGDEYFQQIRLAAFVYAEQSTGRHMLGLLASQPGLRHIQMTGGQATDEGFSILTEMPQLTSIHVDHAMRLTDRGLGHLRGMTGLKKVILYNARITDAGLQQLDDLRLLEVLMLPASTISDDGLRALDGKEDLRVLTLSADGLGLLGITDVGLARIASHRKLGVLSLRGAAISDDGLRHLAGLKSLEYLTLANCHAITDAGLKHLAVLKNLKHLGLAGTSVTGPGLEHLKGLALLRSLSIPSDASQSAVNRFRAAMPSGVQIR